MCWLILIGATILVMLVVVLAIKIRVLRDDLQKIAKRHKSKTDPDVWICQFCEQVYRGRDEAIEHLRETHNAPGHNADIVEYLDRQ